MPTKIFLQALTENVLPNISATSSERAFEEPPTIDKEDKTMAEAFLYDPNLLRLTDEVYACSQLPSRRRKDPKCEVLTVARALKTASLYSADNLTIADIKNMMTVCFTTAQSCFPCLTWSERGMCYHQMAIAQLREENRISTINSAD